MAKFEGNYPEEVKGAPPWFSSFDKNFSLVIKFLNVAGRRGLNLNDNILSVPVTNTVTHAQPLRFQHNLGVTPVLTQVQGGRYICYKITEANKSLSTITFYLMASPVTSTTEYSSIDFIDVLDSSIFSVNDQVTVSGQTRKIKSLVGNRLTLDSAIRLSLPAVVTLNTESITAVFL